MRVAPGRLTAWPDPVQGPIRVRALVRLGAAPNWWQSALTYHPVAAARVPTAAPVAAWWVARSAAPAAAPAAAWWAARPAPITALVAWASPTTIIRPTQPISMKAAGTGPAAPLATNTGNVNAVPIAKALDPTQAVYPIPSNLAAVLDNATALTMREYVALNPADFQAWLNQYAGHLVLRNNLYLEALTNPPPGGYQLTPQMVATLGGDALKVTLALKGIAAGQWGDIFGMASTVAGAIPGVDSNFMHAVQGVALAYNAVKSISDVVALASAHGASVLDLTSAAGMAGVYPGLSALPIAGVLMAVGLVVDIGFTIAGNAPDIQKAIDVALDAASLAVLFIPGIGIVIAIVIQLVKFIIDLFAGDLFGGGLSHTQREALEAARYGAYINPMFGQLAAAYTPRELLKVVISWGSGSCGGTQAVAMAFYLHLNQGDTLQVGGRSYTVPVDTAIGGYLAPGCYQLQGTPFAAITFDELAWALGMYGSTNGVTAEAQAGISEARKAQFDDPTTQLIAARTAPMRTFLQHGLSLDQIDQIAAEYRAQPTLAALATAFGYPDWQHLFGDVVDAEWRTFSAHITHGTLTDFARANGYRTMYDFRRAALASYQSAFARVQAVEDWYHQADGAQQHADQMAAGMAGGTAGGGSP